MACFWTELLRVVEDCPSGEAFSILASNGYCYEFAGGNEPLPPEFIIGDDFTIVLSGDNGEVYFTDWDDATPDFERYTVDYPGGLVQGQGYAGMIFQGAESWPCVFTFVLS